MVESADVDLGGPSWQTELQVRRCRWQVGETRSAERRREAADNGGLGVRRVQVAATHADERRREVVARSRILSRGDQGRRGEAAALNTLLSVLP